MIRKSATNRSKPAPPHHRRARTGYARGEETKLRIIHAALELFGSHGYEQTSTRDIAARAGVNAPALQYYFDGKDGLYLACAQHMADRGRALMAPAMAKARAALAGKPDTDTLIDCVWGFLESAADGVLMSRELDSWMRFMAWEDLRRAETRDDARAILDKCFRHEVNQLLRALVGRITGRKADDPQTRIRTVTLMGQITVFFNMREKVHDTLGWATVDAQKLKLLKSIIHGQTVAALKAAAAPRNGG